MFATLTRATQDRDCGDSGSVVLARTGLYSFNGYSPASFGPGAGTTNALQVPGNAQAYACSPDSPGFIRVTPATLTRLPGCEREQQWSQIEDE
jgi:hypothetical protein